MYLHSTCLFSSSKCSLPSSGIQVQMLWPNVHLTPYMSPLCIATRPDLSSAVGVLNQFMNNPRLHHVKGVKRVLRYIKGTLHYGICFDKSSDADFKLYGFSDADWASDVNMRKSTSGYICRIGGATIVWKSKRQSIAALSSTEAEYVALSSATQDIVWLRSLLAAMGLEQKEATKLHEDIQGSISLSKNPKSHSHTKHIGIKFHYVSREEGSKYYLLCH